MRLFAIAKREAGERGRLLAIACVLAVVPFALALPLRHFAPPREIVNATAIALAAMYGVVVALITGATLVVRDASDGRLSFYLSRPVTLRALWGGKLAGAMFIAFGGLVISALPLIAEWTTPLFIAAFFAVLLFVLLGHACATSLRLRSAWTYVDVAAAIVAGIALTMMLRPLIRNDARALLTLNVVIAIAVFMFTVIAAGARQIRHAGSHAAFSKPFWLTVAIALVVNAATLAWVEHPSFDDCILGEDAVVQAGEWIEVGGVSPFRLDWTATFYVNVRTGRTIRVVKPGSWERSVFSDDGESVLWWQNGVLKRLTFSDGRVDDIAVPRTWGRIFAMHEDVVVVNDDSILFVRNRRSIPNPLGTWIAEGRWIAPGTLRLFRIDDDLTDIADVSASGELARHHFDVGSRTFGAAIARDGSRLLLSNSGELTLLDVDRGTLRPLPHSVDSRLLADGRIVQASVTGGQPFIDLLSREGAFLRRFATGTSARVVSQPDANHIAMEVPGAHIVFLDLRDGTTRPARAWARWNVMRYGEAGKVFGSNDDTVYVNVDGRMHRIFRRIPDTWWGRRVGAGHDVFPPGFRWLLDKRHDPVLVY